MPLIWVLTVALMVAYLQASAWSTFEEVVATEGKISRIRRFRKVYEAFLDDITIVILPLLLPHDQNRRVEN